MKTLGYTYAFLCGNTTGTALGPLLVPEKGTDMCSKTSDIVDDFCKKHNIKPSRREAEDFAEDIKDATSDAV